MDLVEIKSKISSSGSPSNSEMKFETLSFDELKTRSEIDGFAKVVLKALLLNFDSEIPLYIHQFQALHALAQGKDVLLTTACGSGKTRVLLNAPMVVKLGFELRCEISESSEDNPLGIVCCPLSSIMEDKINDCPNSGFLTMYGNCKTASSGGSDEEVSLSGIEEEFLSDKLSLIFGHPESFATKLGKKILEANEKRIFVYVTDEVGFNIWGNDFRLLMSSIPGSIRVFTTSNAPMLCMSATVGKQEQRKILSDLGMVHRKFVVIESNPVMDHIFLAKFRRPSNQKGFYEEGGLAEILDKLFLDEFFNDPDNCLSTIIFCKSEDDIVKIYQHVEEEIGNQFQDMKKRPWVQYHSSTGQKTLKWIHHRMKSSENPIKLIISTYKLVMGVDCPSLDLAIFLRYTFPSSLK